MRDATRSPGGRRIVFEGEFGEQARDVRNTKDTDLADCESVSGFALRSRRFNAFAMLAATGCFVVEIRLRGRVKNFGTRSATGVRVEGDEGVLRSEVCGLPPDAVSKVAIGSHVNVELTFELFRTCAAIARTTVASFVPLPVVLGSFTPCTLLSWPWPVSM